MKRKGHFSQINELYFGAAALNSLKGSSILVANKKLRTEFQIKKHPRESLITR